MHSFVFDVAFCQLCSFLENWVTPHQQLEACRSMPQHAGGWVLRGSIRAHPRLRAGRVGGTPPPQPPRRRGRGRIGALLARGPMHGLGRPAAPLPPGGRGPAPQHATAQQIFWGTVGAWKEPPIKLGWEEPRTTARSQCSVKHPGHRAGAHTTRVKHEAHATRNQQGTRPAHERPAEWGSVRGGRPRQRVEEQGTWASRTRKHSEAGCGRELWGQQKQSNDPRNNQHILSTPTTGRR